MNYNFNITKIDKSTFEGCEALNAVTYPDSEDRFESQVIVALGNERFVACLQFRVN